MTARAALFPIAAVLACAPPPPVADGPAPTAVTLERTPCFGTCPVYQVAISRSGMVRFVGKQHVTRQGAATAEIPVA
jgi:hypothetical protein